jgi:hypothetical protein
VEIGTVKSAVVTEFAYGGNFNVNILDDKEIAKLRELCEMFETAYKLGGTLAAGNLQEICTALPAAFDELAEAREALRDLHAKIKNRLQVAKDRIQIYDSDFNRGEVDMLEKLADSERSPMPTKPPLGKRIELHQLSSLCIHCGKPQDSWMEECTPCGCVFYAGGGMDRSACGYTALKAERDKLQLLVETLLGNGEVQRSVCDKAAAHDEAVQKIRELRKRATEGAYRRDRVLAFDEALSALGAKEEP